MILVICCPLFVFRLNLIGHQLWHIATLAWNVIESIVLSCNVFFSFSLLSSHLRARCQHISSMFSYKLNSNWDGRTVNRGSDERLKSSMIWEVQSRRRTFQAALLKLEPTTVNQIWVLVATWTVLLKCSLHRLMLAAKSVKQWGDMTQHQL